MMMHRRSSLWVVRRALSLCLLAGVTGASATTTASIAPPGFVSDKWTAIDSDSRKVAGVRSQDNGGRALAVHPVCSGKSVDEYVVSFSMELGPMFSIFFNTMFNPALSEDNVSYRIRVDDGETSDMNELSADWRAGLLTVTGTLNNQKQWEALEIGNDVTVKVHMGTSIVSYQSFSLRNSSDALSQLACKQ